MRRAMIGSSGLAGLMVMAWPSSMPSAFVCFCTMGSFGQPDQIVAEILPTLAAIGGAHGARDLQRRVYLQRVARALDHPHHPRGEGTNTALRNVRRGQAAPARTPIVRAIHTD